MVNSSSKLIMRTLSSYLIILLLICSANSCRKDYPEDTPDWLKSRIKEWKKESRGAGCVGDVCREIQEYSDGIQTIYWIKSTGTPTAYKVYDFEGNEQCYFETTQPATCGSISNFQNYQFTRMIWIED